MNLRPPEPADARHDRGAQTLPSATAPLARPVTNLWGVGSERAAQLARLRIVTLEDLLLHRPRRYEDRRHFKSIARLDTTEPVLSRGTVTAMGLKTYRKGAKSVFELILDDGTARLHCRWWNLPFMEHYFAVGNQVLVFGKLTGLKPRTMDHPETEVVEESDHSSIHMNRIVPVYPLTEGVQQRWLRGLIRRALETHGAEDASRTAALRMLHAPETLEETQQARRMLALEEFVAMQTAIRERRLRFEARARAVPCRGDNRLIKPFLAALGFRLTAAQTRVLREIRADLGGRHPMRRLLQGDVGAGKTVVAACTALMALESGRDAALMAPTEILAEQHFQTFTRWLQPLGLTVELRTGSRKTCNIQHSTSNIEGGARVHSATGPAKAAIRNRSREGGDPQSALLTIGTHALISDGFEMPRLGLVIIDEQHKFGVAHRKQLVRKGDYPHLLVMTATPIPRSLGLTLYGDLDLSVIDEAPANRGRVRTHVRSRETLPRVWAFVKEQLAQGRQAYVVYPRVEETDGGNTRAVKEEFTRIQSALAPHTVAMLHGRMSAAEKSAVMEGFRANRIQALLATSLIEVGLDVAHATVMVIEDADRFGLAQLHQLRGRIGRGTHESHCILVAGRPDPEARGRLEILKSHADGFAIAEADLKLRGPGELLGQQQSGMPPLRFGSLTEDWDLIQQARAKVMAGAKTWREPPGRLCRVGSAGASG